MEMKKAWIAPKTTVQTFDANESVAACWWVNCNIGKGNVYLEDNGVEGLQTSGWNSDTMIGWNVSGCNTKHIGVTETPVNNSYWVSRSGTTRACFSWYDWRGWHSSYVEDAQWETNPNAS